MVHLKQMCLDRGDDGIFTTSDQREKYNNKQIKKRKIEPNLDNLT